MGALLDIFRVKNQLALETSLGCKGEYETAVGGIADISTHSNVDTSLGVAIVLSSFTLVVSRGYSAVFCCIIESRSIWSIVAGSPCLSRGSSILRLLQSPKLGGARSIVIDWEGWKSAMRCKRRVELQVRVHKDRLVGRCRTVLLAITAWPPPLRRIAKLVGHGESLDFTVACDASCDGLLLCAQNTRKERVRKGGWV